MCCARRLVLNIDEQHAIDTHGDLGAVVEIQSLVVLHRRDREQPVPCLPPLLFDQPRLLETEIRLAADDDRVQHAQAENPAGFGQLLVGAPVRLAGLHVARGVVVGQDDGRRPVGGLLPSGVTLIW